MKMQHLGTLVALATLLFVAGTAVANSATSTSRTAVECGGTVVVDCYHMHGSQPWSCIVYTNTILPGIGDEHLGYPCFH